MANATKQGVGDATLHPLVQGAGSYPPLLTIGIPCLLLIIEDRKFKRATLGGCIFFREKIERKWIVRISFLVSFFNLYHFTILSPKIHTLQKIGTE